MVARGGEEGEVVGGSGEREGARGVYGSLVSSWRRQHFPRVFGMFVAGDDRVCVLVFRDDVQPPLARVA